MRILLSVLGASTLLAAVTIAQTPAPTEPESAAMQTVHHFTATQTRKLELNYLLFLPKGYDAKGEKRWPLLLFLHGAGERGTNIWKVTTHGPPKNLKAHPEFPFIVVSPQCPDGQVWSRETLLALLEDITRKLAVDEKRLYLTGLSMGGFGTWDLGVSHPEKFAAIVPICGGGERIKTLLASREKAAALKTLGVWAFHGGKDPVVPLEESERMVDALKKAGVTDIKLTVYPEAGHDSWTETYKNPELYDWLLQHHR